MLNEQGSGTEFRYCQDWQKGLGAYCAGLGAIFGCVMCITLLSGDLGPLSASTVSLAIFLGVPSVAMLVFAIGYSLRRKNALVLLHLNSLIVRNKMGQRISLHPEDVLSIAVDLPDVAYVGKVVVNHRTGRITINSFLDNFEGFVEALQKSEFGHLIR